MLLDVLPSRGAPGVSRLRALTPNTGLDSSSQLRDHWGERRTRAATSTGRRKVQVLPIGAIVSVALFMLGIIVSGGRLGVVIRRAKQRQELIDILKRQPTHDPEHLDSLTREQSADLQVIRDRRERTIRLLTDGDHYSGAWRAGDTMDPLKPLDLLRLAAQQFMLLAAVSLPLFVTGFTIWGWFTDGWVALVALVPAMVFAAFAMLVLRLGGRVAIVGGPVYLYLRTTQSATLAEVDFRITAKRRANAYVGDDLEQLLRQVPHLITGVPTAQGPTLAPTAHTTTALTRPRDLTTP